MNNLFLQLLSLVKRKDLIFGGLAALFVYYVNIDLAVKLPDKEFVEVFIALPIISFISLISSLGFAQYMIYWIKWNKAFNFPLMIALQCLLSVLTLFLVKNLGLNNFIENYFVLVLALVTSQKTVDSLMQYCLLTIDRSHFFFSFYFIKGSVLIGIYFIFIYIRLILFLHIYLD